jgi:hypothetical protein
VDREEDVRGRDTGTETGTEEEGAVEEEEELVDAHAAVVFSSSCSCVCLTVPGATAAGGTDADAAVTGGASSPAEPAAMNALTGMLSKAEDMRGGRGR